MIQAIFQGMTEGAQGFLNTLKAILESVLGMFGTTVEGTYTLNPFGILTVAVVGVGIAYFGIRWITRLIKLRG